MVEGEAAVAVVVQEVGAMLMRATTQTLEISTAADDDSSYGCCSDADVAANEAAL